MGFRCDYCKQPQPPGTRGERIPIEIAIVEHPGRGLTNGLHDLGGEGTRVIAEAIACASCVAGLSNLSFSAKDLRPATTRPSNVYVGPTGVFRQNPEGKFERVAYLPPSGVSRAVRDRRPLRYEDIRNQDKDTHA